MTALKVLNDPKVAGDKFTGAEYTQVEIGCQGFRDSFTIASLTRNLRLDQRWRGSMGS